MACCSPVPMRRFPFLPPSLLPPLLLLGLTTHVSPHLAHLTANGSADDGDGDGGMYSTRVLQWTQVASTYGCFNRDVTTGTDMVVMSSRAGAVKGIEARAAQQGQHVRRQCIHDVNISSILILVVRHDEYVVTRSGTSTRLHSGPSSIQALNEDSCRPAITAPMQSSYSSRGNYSRLFCTARRHLVADNSDGSFSLRSLF